MQKTEGEKLLQLLYLELSEDCIKQLKQIQSVLIQISSYLSKINIESYNTLRKTNPKLLTTDQGLKLKEVNLIIRKICLTLITFASIPGLLKNDEIRLKIENINHTLNIILEYKETELE